MSGKPSRDLSKMTTFFCRACADYWMVPTNELRTGTIDGYDLSQWRAENGVPTRCLNCIAVIGAIEKMRNLIFQNPWLETEGMAGEPKKEAWELVGVEMAGGVEKAGGVDSGIASHCSSNGDGRTLQESEKFRAEMLEDFLKHAGAGMTEDEALELEGEEESEEDKKTK
jgi:hypothetical protein